MNPFRSAFWSSIDWTFKLGVLVAIVIALLLILAPWIAPYDPTAQVLTDRLQPPSMSHWMGTDQLGRDQFSRLLHGGRFSVSVATLAVLLSALIGTLLGALAASLRGLFDEALMRAVDLIIAFPEVILAMFLVYALGPSFSTLVIALVATGWTPFARLSRALAMEIDTRDYIEAAQALGCSRAYIIVRHVIPNASGPIIAQLFLRFGGKLITVGGLSYLGLGVQPPNADWGTMLADAGLYMVSAPWLILFPGAAIFFTAAAVMLAGHGLMLPRRQPRVKAASKEVPA